MVYGTYGLSVCGMAVCSSVLLYLRPTSPPDLWCGCGLQLCCSSTAYLLGVSMPEASSLPVACLCLVLPPSHTCCRCVPYLPPYCTAFLLCSTRRHSIPMSSACHHTWYLTSRPKVCRVLRSVVGQQLTATPSLYLSTSTQIGCTPYLVPGAAAVPYRIPVWYCYSHTSYWYIQWYCLTTGSLLVTPQI